MSYKKAAMAGVPYNLQSLATTGNGLVINIPPSITKHSILIRGNDIPSAGAVQPECADDPTYTGTWAPLGGGPITVPDGELVYNFEGTFKAIRCRVSTDVTSGTVDCIYTGVH